MKPNRFFFALTILLLCLGTQEAMAQEPQPPATPTVDELLNTWTLLTSGLITLLTYLSGLFPQVTIFKADKKRDLGIKAIIATVVVGAVMIALGPINNIQLVVAFVTSVLTYDKVLKPLGATTKTNAGANAQE